jgi:hypothetical protein
MNKLAQSFITGYEKRALDTKAFFAALQHAPIRSHITLGVGAGALTGALASGGAAALHKDPETKKKWLKQTLVGGGLGALTGAALGAPAGLITKHFRDEASFNIGKGDEAIEYLKNMLSKVHTQSKAKDKDIETLLKHIENS